MKTQEVRELTDKELVERIGTERANLSKMKLNHAISPIDNPCQIREARKTVARLLTEKRRREMNK
ncbi:MAG: 50S ribosomal protein L29 [Paludibacteraceae bacterium]|jgi:large subunit ribosomal protein L29|nr:50S ribosomal protein L29 [Paludibacteraceae bacterium]MBQ6732118.1 50S ribosomal protein L29 [Paludibacteraceae bacterium]MDY6374033.1 50S ribosomal protein L29 [Bacteroidales bacterium]MDY6427270.1 50S ribosomal protein L29 [Bacteroidales bacterium]